MDHTSPGVYQGVMRPSKKISPNDLDRLFAGRGASPGGELDDISGLVHKVQSRYLSEIDPDLETSHLAALMQVVNLTDKGDLAARPASKVDGPARQASGLPKGRRRFVLESFLATVSAKLALGGVAVAMAATGGLAASGNLPDRAQTAISQAVDNVGIDIPSGETAQRAAEQAHEAAEQAAAAALHKAEAAARAAEQSASAGAAQQAGSNAEFGQGVASDANAGGTVGSAVSEAARAQAEERRAAGQANRPEEAGPPAAPVAIPDFGPPSDSGPIGEAGLPAGAGPQNQTGRGIEDDGPAGGSIPTTVPEGKPANVPGGGRP
jgi:hypothetical protein